jgi:hypothetical protein
MKDKIVSKKDSEGILFVYNVKPSTSANFDGPEGIRDKSVTKKRFRFNVVLKGN